MFDLDRSQGSHRSARNSAKSGPLFTPLINNSDWHHFVVVKRASMSYKKANADNTLHDIARDDSLEVFVDGKVATSMTGLEAGTNPVPKWGAVDCGGVMLSTSLINSPTFDHVLRRGGRRGARSVVSSFMIILRKLVLPWWVSVSKFKIKHNDPVRCASLARSTGCGLDIAGAVATCPERVAAGRLSVLGRVSRLSSIPIGKSLIE